MRLVNKIILSLCLLIFCVSLDLSAQRYGRNQKKAQAQVSFIIKSSQNIKPNNIYVTGDLPGFGPWDPRRVPLFSNPDGSWIGTIKIPLGVPVKIQYTQGSFEATELNLQNESVIHSLYLTKDTIIRHRINRWGTGGIGTAEIAPPKPVSTTTDYIPVKPVFQFVKQHRDFGGSGVGPRNITVFLPPSYEEEVAKEYPVLYIHDGPQSYNASFSVSDNIRSTADYAKSMIKKGELDELIIVLINNKSDYQFKRFNTNIHPAYRKFVTKTLKPFIDQTYRTKSDARYNANLGVGLNALISFLISYENHNDFGKVACLSPIFESERLYYSYASKFKNDDTYRDLKIFFDNGVSTQEKRLQPSIERMVSLLESKGYNPSFSIKGGSSERIKAALRSLFSY